MIATVANQGKTRWMIIDETFNPDKLIEFLEALIKDAGKKVFLILDNLRVHHSKPVKACAADRQDKIERIARRTPLLVKGDVRDHAALAAALAERQPAGVWHNARMELKPGADR